MLGATRTTAPFSADRIVATVMEWIGHGAELKDTLCYHRIE